MSRVVAVRLSVSLGHTHRFQAEGEPAEVDRAFRLWCEALIYEWSREAEVARASARKHLGTLRKALNTLKAERTTP